MRALATAGARPRTRAALAGVLRELGFTVAERSPGAWDVVVTEL